MIKNTWTAQVTPFDPDGGIDWEGLRKNISFQMSQGITGIVAVGTTGESPSLSWDEHNRVIAETISLCKGKVGVIAGTGSNCTGEAIESSRYAAGDGADGLLLVDCYYNGPSSSELRDEYYGRIAEAVPEAECIPYIVPGRTGTSVQPADLALLCRKYKNINAVKEASGNKENMKLTRRLCGDGFSIISGDDGLTCELILDKDIRCNGVISVVSNIAPGALSKMVSYALEGDREKAEALDKTLRPLHDIVGVAVENKRDIPGYGIVTVKDKYRNPLPTKVLMNVLGMPSGPARPPLGRMSAEGLRVVRAAVSSVKENHPEILAPVCDFYGVDAFARIEDDDIWNSML
ncbi:MAG: 4-hydroxy-tetrahydrodipicolinate synthase [Abditibacteriota bacterium]|nr:4-hydroxy-tetrahydrodipicolinate synthase [Abditibacteriota bacterium]